MGFAAAGITRARPSDDADKLRSWLDHGLHGSMGYMAEHTDLRLDPAALLPGARSIIMVADLYAGRDRSLAPLPPPPQTDQPEANQPDDPAAPTPTPAPPPSPFRGRIARYARGRDYHRVIKARLHALSDALTERFPGHRFRTFVDTAPVMEREHAQRAGLGWRGKHTLLIHPRHGSWLLLGGVMTTLDLDLDLHPHGLTQSGPTRPDPIPVTDHCGSCTRCIDACPTDAITPYRLDARRCISYLTIERQEPIDPALHHAMGDWVFGCDICQEVCPHNSPKPGRAMPNPAYAPKLVGLDPLAVLGWDEAARRSTLAGTPMTWISLDMWKRNAIIALANAILDRPIPGATPADIDAAARAIARFATDLTQPPLVRQAAQASLERLGALAPDPRGITHRPASTTPAPGINHHADPPRKPTA